MQCPIQMYFGSIWTVWAAQENVPKKVLVIFFLYIFHVKAKWNIVYQYLKAKIFSRDTNIIPQMHWTLNISGHSATTIGSFWVSLNYPILNLKKMVYPLNVWMQHCHESDWFLLICETTLIAEKSDFCQNFQQSMVKEHQKDIYCSNVWIVSVCYIQTEDCNALLHETVSKHFSGSKC